MDALPRPKPPPLLRLALLLIYVLIAVRIWLIQRALVGGFGSLLGGSRDPSSGEGGSVSIWSALEAAQVMGEGPLVPGSFGNPLLFVMLIPILIITRRLMRRGYRLAADTFLAYLALRGVLIVVRGPYSPEAALLLGLTVLIFALLVLPTSRRWFEDCARRRSLASAPPARS